MKKSTTSAVGRVIKSFRTEQNLTQQQFAKRAGLHPQTVSNLERGAVGVPTIHLKRLAKTGINRDALIRSVSRDFTTKITNLIR